jgi:hypothetical protein
MKQPIRLTFGFALKRAGARQAITGQTATGCE